MKELRDYQQQAIDVMEALQTSQHNTIIQKRWHVLECQCGQKYRLCLVNDGKQTMHINNTPCKQCGYYMSEIVRVVTVVT
jgi:hypothetical protein